MAEPEEDASSEIRAAVRAVLDDPAGGRSRIPTLLAALDEDDRESRLSAAWALTLVATANPDLVEAVARRLADRVAADALQLETRHALGYLGGRYPERVDAVLENLAEEADERDRRRRYLELSQGFARSDYVGQSERNRDVGRTQTPAEAGSPGPQRVYREEGEAVGGPPEDARGDDARDRLDDDSGGPAADEAGGDGTDDEQDDGTAEGRSPSPAAQRREQEAELAAVADAIGVDRIAANSRFDDVQVVSRGVEGRFATVYRSRVTVDGSEEGVALGVFEPPEDADGFEASVAGQLENWAAVSDHDGVATLYDWGTDPSLWMATAFTGESLYDRLDLSIDEAVWNGRKVAEAVAAIHQRGVVHAGIDPYNVVYTGTTIADRQRPLVSNVGLLTAMRMYVDPASLLDPRFAAPEYFDRGYGDVDHATDIYQLGAVVYYLVTGRPPFQGTYGEVRTGVLESTPPLPSEINPEIPAWLDDVLRTAMAKQKLTRYETATQVARELERRAAE
ncbi:serine/threonine-protein kinase [Halorientalis pallida]|uniref:serine/threonine-protein kinase n=1 Tax=Halorientalis pallida TaxID=2479928 RepID=UPI003C6FE9F1